MDLRTLAEGDRPAIHQTFLAAFADYAVPANFDRPTLDRLMARRGAELGASVAAFDGTRMVAVMVTAVREHERRLSAYDVFTGVRPEYRGKQLAGRLFEAARGPLADRGANRFLLEVIRTNTAAIRAYEKSGFRIRRDLDCYELGKITAQQVHGVELQIDNGLPDPAWCEWHEHTPSWQNSDASLRSAAEERRLIRARSAGQTVGYAVVFPDSRDLPRLAVHPGWRRRGIGRALAARAVAELDADQPLRVINVDASDTTSTAFFAGLAKADLPRQHEMVLDFER